jgi:signal transduction histidine kinase
VLSTEVAEASAESRFAIDPDDFGRIIDNLVNNAADAGAGRRVAVEVRLAIDDATFTLEVADDAGGMPDDFVQNAADRFRRAGTNRSPTGVGLGLSIVGAITHKARGELELRNRRGEGLTVRITIPVTA